MSMPTYYFPQSLFKQAGPADKIRAFNVQRPSVAAFIYKYENLIPWSNLERTEQAIQEFIRSTLLTDLAEKIDPKSDNSNYLKNIDVEKEYRNAGNDPQIQQAWAMYQHNPAEARQFLMDTINDEKRNTFAGWWQYLMQDNPIYAEDPAFVYSIFNPVLRSSPDDVKRAPVSVNAEAVANVYEKINEDPQTNIFKAYKQEVTRLHLESSTAQTQMDREGGNWIFIPGREKEPGSFKENVQKLKDLSAGTGWCTASGMAKNYLERGNFWLYIIDGKAQVAIRDQAGEVVEIRGHNNKPPKDFTRPIFEFLESSKLEYRRSPHFKELKEIELLSRNLQDPSKKEGVVNSIIKSIQLDWGINLGMYEKLSQQQKEDHPDIVERAAKKIEELLVATLANEESNKWWRYRFLPPEIRQLIHPDVKKSMAEKYQNQLERFETSIAQNQHISWPDIPDDIIPYIPQDILTKAAKILVTKKGAHHLKYIPEDIGKFISHEEVIQGVSATARSSPYSLRYIPEEVILSVPSEQWLEICTQLAKSHVHIARGLPPSIKKQIPREIWVEGWGNAIKSSPVAYKQAPKKYKQDLFSLAVETYNEYFTKNIPTAARWRAMAEELKPWVKDSVISKWQSVLLQKPAEWKRIPKPLIPSLRPFMTQLLREKLKKRPSYYRHVPMEFQARFPEYEPSFRARVEEARKSIAKNRLSWDDIQNLYPQDILPHLEGWTVEPPTTFAQTSNWLTRLAASKEEYLFNKYKKLARKKWFLPKESYYPPGTYEVAKPRRFDMVGDEFADNTLKEVIEDAMKWNRKYAEWYTYRIIKEYTYHDGRPYHGIGRIGTQSTHQVKDFLERGNGQIPSLQTTMQEVGQLSKEWHEMIAQRAAAYKTHKVVAQLSDGFQLIEVPSEDAQAEGYHMGHCVGSYCEDIQAGKVYVYSLRDANNDPHITFELTPMADSNNHYAIEQMKGKENKPQPKYAKYLEEALDFFMKSPSEITFGEEGFDDYAGFQEDGQLLKKRLKQMDEQMGIHHEHPIMHAYYHSQRGIGDSELDHWFNTENGIAWLEGQKKTEPDWEKYLSFVISESEWHRQELTERIEYNHMNTAITDEESEEDEETITTEEWMKTRRYILRGNLDFWDFTEEMRETAVDYAEMLWEDGTNVGDYLIENDRESVESAFIESLDEKVQSSYVPSEYYKNWTAEKGREREAEKWRKIREKVHDIMARYNIIANPKIDMTELYRGYYFRSGSLTNDEKAAKWIADWITQKTKEWEEYEANETFIETRMEQWKPLIESQVPGYSNLQYWDQRKFIVSFLGKLDVDEEVIEKARTIVNNPVTVASFKWYY